jgi:hypothetical protein
LRSSKQSFRKQESLFTVALFLIELAASLFTVALPLLEPADIQLNKQWERDYAETVSATMQEGRGSAMMTGC